MGSIRTSTRIHPATGWYLLLPASHPIPPSVCLAVNLPKGRWHGLLRSTFHTICERLRSILYAGGILFAWSQTRELQPPPYLLVQACQLFWLVGVHDAADSLPCRSLGEGFTYVDHITQILALTWFELPGRS